VRDLNNRRRTERADIKRNSKSFDKTLRAGLNYDVRLERVKRGLHSFSVKQAL